jgi:PAS domain S-box-containing protein
MTKKRQKKGKTQDKVLDCFSIIKEINTAGCFLDPKGNFIFSNQACDILFGVKKNKLVNRNLKEFVNPKTLKTIIKKPEKEADNVHELEISLGHKKKKFIIFDSSPKYDDNGKFIGSLAFIEDFTGHKKKEEDLLLKCSLLDSLLENLPDCIYFKDINSRFIRVNKARALKSDKDEEFFIGKKDFDFFPEDQAKEMLKDEKKILKKGKKIIEKEQKIIRANGTEEWTLATKVPRYDRDGKIIGTLGISRDITEKKTMEEKLKRRIEALGEEVVFKSNLLASLLDNMPELIYFKDEKSRFIKVSKSLADWSNVENVDDLLGKTDFDFYKADEANIRYEEEKRIMKTGKPMINKEEKYTTPDGGEGWTSTTKLPLYDEKGKTIGTFGISRDITVKKELEEKLKEKLSNLGEEVLFKSDLLTSLLDNIPQNIYFKDKKSRFVAVSKSLADWSNVENVDDLLGKTDFDFYKADEANIRYEEEKRIMKTGKPMINKEEKYTTPDGGEGWVSTTKIPRYDKKGNIIGTLGISRDITEIKKAEREIARLNDLIEQSSDAVLRMDTEMRINYTNKATKELFGYPFSELKKKTLEFLIAEPDSEEIQRRIFGKVSKGEIYSGEHLSIRKNGSVFFCHVKIMPLFDEKNNIYGYMGSLWDISEEKKARDELVFRKNLLDSFLELTPDKVFFKDRDCRFVEMSKSEAEEHNLTREGILGKSDFSFLPEEIAEKYFEEEQNIMKKKQ